VSSAPAPVEGTLSRETNWWGAFVIGLAGTILVLGLVGYALVALGGFAIVLFLVLTAVGVFLCFCLAELAAAFPERAGGLPSYAFETFKPMGEGFARHVGGLSSWAYWLGWFTVAPINALLAALYLNSLFSIPDGKTWGPISTNFGAPVTTGAFVTGVVILVVMFVPCWMGIRLGATFASILGVVSMVPLIMLILLPLAKPSTIDFSRLDGLGLPAGVTGSWQMVLGWAFIFTWSVWAMEAAACYIGECRDPARDARIAMTVEGLFGMFVYGALPIMLLAVLGVKGLADLKTLGDANVIFQGYVNAIFGTNEFWKWFVGLALSIALILSVLNAIMGASRGLWQNAHDGILPRWFGKTNRHGSPSTAMLLSLILSIIVLMVGSALQIYIFSNMGYLFALSVSMIGYGIFRARRGDMERPLKMPAWMGPAAILLGALGLLLWVVGGYYAADYAVGAGFRWLYWVGLLLLALYAPLVFWRRVEDRSKGTSEYSRAAGD
jgi:amino acid transporter